MECAEEEIHTDDECVNGEPEGQAISHGQEIQQDLLRTPRQAEASKKPLNDKQEGSPQVKLDEPEHEDEKNKRLVKGTFKDRFLSTS